MKLFVLLSLLFSSFCTTAFADEGMWTFDRFPKKALETKYKFKTTDVWTNKVRLSAARLAGGCSASFVSKNGLIMTNHHCARGCIQELSTKKNDYIANGFYAKTAEEEVKCPTMEVNRLDEIKDVTAVLAKSTKGLKGKAYNDALKAEMSKLEKECAGSSQDLRCDVVTLYKGGRYDLYKYRRFQDVRLVFAPENAIAFFGGDPDNFTFPRYDLDVAFVRIYEDGKPHVAKEYFRWAKADAKEGDLTFVTGHPGKTSRLLTVAELEFDRDVRMMNTLMLLAELRGFLTEYQKRGPEQKRHSQNMLFGVENGYKAILGRHQALSDKKFFAQKVAEEKTLLAKVNARPAWKKEYAGAWKQLADIQGELKSIYNRAGAIEYGGFNSNLYGFAKTLVRASVELPKPNEKRLREFVDSAMPQLKQQLFSTAPVFEEFEIANLTFALTKARELLTVDDPFIKTVYGNRSPEQIAQEIVKGTKLKDPKFREELFNGGREALEASSDPLVKFALAVDPEARKIRDRMENEIEPVIKAASEKVGQARFAVYGTNTYPDATFTLRMSYGQVKGYDINGRHIDPVTKIAGTYERHTGADPFKLPESWLKAKSKINMEAPMNVCTTNDIIGGNSGSPLINRDAEVVGLIFDGNLQSLGGAYGFDESQNRAIAVSSGAIMEALKTVYGADRVISDIQDSQTAP